MPSADLDRSDFHSLTWGKIRAYYEARLALLRRTNDGDLNPLETARLRGQISECRHFLSLDAAVDKSGRPVGLPINV
jgi:hypothetical protein